MASTIKDIKEETGLSLATISKYLNGGNVLPKNRDKIEAAIEKLDYHVNEIARGLVTNKTRTVGVMVYSIASIFNGTLVAHIGHQLRRRGYGMFICDSGEDTELEAKNVRFLVSKKVDGMIVIPTADTASFLEPAKEAGIPVVLVDRRLSDGEIDSVTLNNEEAAKQAVERLIGEGHRKLAIISSADVFTGVDRYKGYRDALEEAGITVPEEYLHIGHHTVAYGYQSMKELMALEDPPTAIFMTNYDINLGTVMALNELGLKCPADVSLLGFDDLLLPHIVEPSLTVMKQPMRELGHQAVDLLLDRIDGRITGDPEHIVLKARLIEGDSDRAVSV